MTNRNVAHFYREASSDDGANGHFYKVIPLHHSQSIDFQSVCEMVPDFPKGWFELSKLNDACRIEFVRDFWMSKLPYRKQFAEFILTFFNNLEEIGIYVTQQTFDSPCLAQMVYSLKDHGGFFRGSPPATAQQILDVKKKFSQFILPEDYLAFLQIHDGFSKSTDTGMIKCSKLCDVYKAYQVFLEGMEPLTTKKFESVDPKSFIPFYESFGLHCYQCFFADWYPEQEMGNIYYSGIDHTMSDYQNRNLLEENLAFPTFLDWLTFYLKSVEEL